MNNNFIAKDSPKKDDVIFLAANLFINTVAMTVLFRETACRLAESVTDNNGRDKKSQLQKDAMEKSYLANDCIEFSVNSKARGKSTTERKITEPI